MSMSIQRLVNNPQFLIQRPHLPLLPSLCPTTSSTLTAARFTSSPPTSPRIPSRSCARRAMLGRVAVSMAVQVRARREMRRMTSLGASSSSMRGSLSRETSSLPEMWQPTWWEEGDI
ncbi:unnamed protein product [Closterium sp. NIES-53]